MKTPAFPSQMVEGWSEGSSGMTLRDWFAGQVLAGAAALPWGAGDCAARAATCYQMADAMLAARGDA